MHATSACACENMHGIRIEGATVFTVYRLHQVVISWMICESGKLILSGYFERYVCFLSTYSIHGLINKSMFIYQTSVLLNQQMYVSLKLHGI